MEIFGVCVIYTPASGAGANDLAADSAVGMGRSFESTFESLLDGIGIVSENIADARDSFEADEGEIDEMTVVGSRNGDVWI